MAALQTSERICTSVLELEDSGVHSSLQSGRVKRVKIKCWLLAGHKFCHQFSGKVGNIKYVVEWKEET